MPQTKPLILDERTDTIIVSGGLDQVTPKINQRPGVPVAGENWEVTTTGHLRRVTGYERKDGHLPRPSDALPVYVSIETFLSEPAIGAPIIGGVSAATAVVASLGYRLINLYNVSGTFVEGETLFNNLVPVGVVMTTIPVSVAEQARHTAASANQARAAIEAVPGSGPVRGVFHLILDGNNEYYALRDNEGGTAKDLYQMTTAGWVQVLFDNEVSFTAGGTGVPVDGNTLTQGGVTATITRVMRESGSWAAGTAAGRLVFSNIAGGSFAAGAATAGSVGVTVSGAASAVTLAAGGKCEFWKTNFLGSTAGRRIYGADGAGRAFEFDGTTLVTLKTNSTPEEPAHVIEYKGYLFLAIGASALHSGPGLPYCWTAADGAGEIAVGSDITNFNSHPGSQESSSLGMYTMDSTHFIFGSSPSDWKREPYKNGVGAYPFTAQTLDHAYVFHHIGVIDYRAAESFGNYVQAALTSSLQPFIDSVRTAVSCSTVQRDKSQYRVFFSDGAGLFVTVVNGRLRGSMPTRFPHAFYCTHESVLVDGSPITLAGGANGMVYELERGTSFDGESINAPLTLSWFYGKNPRMLKTWKRVLFELEADGYVEFRLGSGLQYGDTEAMARHLDLPVVQQATGVPVWDGFTWDEFYWDGSPPIPSLQNFDGSSVNIQFSLSCVSAVLRPFTLSALIVNYLNRRLER